jgi:hypothetical protein
VQGSHVTIHVEVPDVEATLAKAERLGGAADGPDTVGELEIDRRRAYDE